MGNSSGNLPDGVPADELPGEPPAPCESPVTDILAGLFTHALQSADDASTPRRRTEGTDGALNAATMLYGGAILRWQTEEAGVLLLASRGGPVTAPVAVQQLSSLRELGERLSGDAVVGYRGCDSVSHYFCVPSGDAYCLPRAAWAVTAMPITLGFCIPLLYAEHRLIVPPPEWSTHTDLLSLQWILDD